MEQFKAYKGKKRQMLQKKECDKLASPEQPPRRDGLTRISHRLDAAVVEVASPVEHHAGDVLRLAQLGQELPDLGGPVLRR